MNRNTIRQVESLLEFRGFDELIGLCLNDKQAWKALQRSLYSTDDSLIWPAVETTAMVVKRWWDEGNEEKVREYIRGLFWSLNDESGGIGWNAPQTIAETISLIPDLVTPYGSMMIDRTMGEPLLVPSGMWGIGRLGTSIRLAVSFFQEPVLYNFTSTDPKILGLTAWAMGEVKFEPALPALRELKGRSESVKIYIEGSFHSNSLESWANQSIRKITPGYTF